MRVSSAEFIKNYGTLTDRALGEPVTITRNGRERLVLISAEEYARLKRRDRRALSAGELSDAVLSEIAAAEVPAGFEHLDEELKASQP